MRNELEGLCEELFRLPSLAMLKLDHNRIPEIPPAIERLGSPLPARPDPARAARTGPRVRGRLARGIWGRVWGSAWGRGVGPCVGPAWGVGGCGAGSVGKGGAGSVEVERACRAEAQPAEGRLEHRPRASGGLGKAGVIDGRHVTGTRFMSIAWLGRCPFGCGLVRAR